MKKIMKIKYKGDIIEFGMVDNQAELCDVFRFRYEVYVSKGHIRKNSEEIDKDSHDDEGKSIHIIAKNKSEIIGNLRIMIENPLPIKKDYFGFMDSARMAKIPEEKKVEIGRIISRPKKSGLELPRHVLMLGLFYSALIWVKENGYLAGYGTVKTSVRKKFKAINLPVWDIKEYEIKFKEGDKSDSSNDFFTDKVDPPWPVYYLRDEIYRYLKSIFSNKLLFAKNEGAYIMKSGLLLNLYLIVIARFRKWGK